MPDVLSAGLSELSFLWLQLRTRVFQESLCNRLASRAGNACTCLQQWDRSSWDSSSTLAGTCAVPDVPTQTRDPSELHHSPFFASDSYRNDAASVTFSVKTQLLTGRMTDVTASGSRSWRQTKFAYQRSVGLNGTRLSNSSVGAAGGLHSELGATVTSPFQKRSRSFIELSNGISLRKPPALVNRFIGKFIISQSGQLTAV